MRPYEERKQHGQRRPHHGGHAKPCQKPNQSVNCEKVIEEYHRLIKEAEGYFAKSDEIIYKEAFEYVWNALKALEKSMELFAKGVEDYEKAGVLLEKSGCDSKCNKNSRRCMELEKEFQKLNELEVEKIMSAMRLLEKVIFEIKDAEECDKKAYELEEEFVKCVHESKGEADCKQKQMAPQKQGYYKKR